MKTKRIILSAATFLSALSMIGGPKIVEVHKSGGCFRRYNDIHQIYLGTLNDLPWWQLNCKGCGFEKCKTYMMDIQNPGDPEVDAYDELATNDVIDIVGAIIDDGNPTGSDTYHYVYTLSDNTTLDIYIQASWQPDGSGGSNIHLEINH